MKNIAILSFFIITIVWSGLFAMQPVDKIKLNPAAFNVKQGAGQCGPASFYLIFRYYGDDKKNICFSKGINGPLFRMDISSLKSEKGNTNNDNSAVIIKRNSPVSKWMNGRSGSTDWGELTAAVNELYYLKKDGKKDRYYSVIESNDDVISPSQSNLQSRKVMFFDRIVLSYLDMNRPVIVHLKRKWPYSGHYIVLIGYDRNTSTIFYMDPNNKSGEIVRKVSSDSFLCSYWYEGDPELNWGNACWSGRWIGFYREETAK